MSALNNSIGLRVIGGDGDVVDIVPGSKDIQCLDKQRTIVSHNFSKRAPSAEDILKDKSGQGYAVFHSKHPPLWISGECAMGLDDVPVATCLGHQHHVNVSFVKETPNNGHRWQDMQLCGLADSTFMTCMDIPLDVFNEQWPPEAQKELGMDCEDTFVPEVIMSLLDQPVMLLFLDNQLMVAMGLSTPKGPV
ncbi:hypothetical protein PAXINDRAFT_14453 [Paxillus involutus ATCC 200175]|uniref:Uncharacterized protein n=1 Tax=Paxillus involutus ATCC 200175 TaxID=664439 RepID=A0A0C9SUH1_PAXIN|nr:hypothetical protein PAXINDRAFT_14453 [Paxillus involutus ATCC 200175]